MMRLATMLVPEDELVENIILNAGNIIMEKVYGVLAKLNKSLETTATPLSAAVRSLDPAFNN